MPIVRRLMVIAAAAVCFIVLPAPVTAQDAGATGGPPPAGDQPRGVFPVAVVYTNLDGDPTATVPGNPGTQFQPGTGTSQFDRIYGSPTSSWILTADTDRPSGTDEVLVVNGVAELFEGDAATWTTGETIGFLETRCAVNDAGDFAFATNTDGPTSADEYLIGGDPAEATLTVVAQEGGSADPPLTGATWGSTLESAVIAADGTVGFVSDSLDGLPTTENEVAVLGTTLLAQEGVTVPTGQAGGGTETWENFDVNDFWISGDGSSWLLQGDLTGTTSSDDVVVVDGAVVIQEDSIIAGSGFPNPVDGSGIVGVHMDPAGNWMARGNNDTSETDWVVRNGTVIATTGDPIVGGGTELWSDADFSDCFFLHIGDVAGNWIIGGVSDASSDSNGVLVLNGDTEVVRESDPIDLDGNGSFDDDLFFDTFGNDDAYLASDGTLYIVATVKDGTGTRVGQGLFTVDLSSIIPVELQSFSVE